MGFELQMVIRENGVATMAGPVRTVAAVSSTNKSAVVRVLSSRYWDPAEAPPPPFYDKEQVQIGGQFLVASEDFGAGLGSETGTATAVATSLVTALNRVSGVEATSDGDTVYILSRRPEHVVSLQATNDTSALLGGVSFQVQGPSGEVLSAAGSYRRTHQIPRLLPFQTAPIALP
jgi:hypothetical protein